MSVIVSRLALDHFRSWDHCIIDLPEGVTVIQGANGMGKTNLVEAIEVLSTGSSHRTSSSLPLVQRGYDSATVRANIVDTNVADGEAAGAQPRNIAESANTELASDSSESSSEEQNGKLNSNQDSLQNSSSGHGDAAQPDRNTQNRAPYTTIELTIRAHGANRARIDGGASMYMRDILGRIPSVSFTPEDQRLVSGDPATRRGFINQAGTLLIPGYDEVHQTCAKIARQRAALLKQLGKSSVQDGRYNDRYGQGAPSDADAGQAAAMQPALSGLEIWTGQFIESGVELTRMRKRLIDQLAPLFSQNYDALSGSKQHASLVYLPSFDEVLVDGEPAQMGQRIQPGQRVQVGDVILGGEKEEQILLAVYKPVGVICTTDKREKRNIVDYVGYPSRIYPIGRLDKDSEGLILMTNDGSLVNRMMRSTNRHEKEYLVEVDREVTEEFVSGMSRGVPILDTVTKKCLVEKTGPCAFRIVLTQGLNRQIRRMCEYFGYRVKRLHRIRVMNIELGDLKPGEYRKLTPKEIAELDRLTGSGRKDREG